MLNHTSSFLGLNIFSPPIIQYKEVLEQALRYVEKGYTLRDAAKILGVGYGTLARYLTTNATLRARYYEARARAKRRKK